LGRDDLINDPRFQSDQSRWEHRNILDPIASKWVADQTAEEVISAAEKIPIPAGLCNSHTEVAKDPQVTAREMLKEVPTPDGKSTVLVTNVPFGMSVTPLKIERSIPSVGQNNEEIYCGLLGYRREDLDQFIEDGVI
jgi:crotonobetainyl-CoA:carnitine CoA-transferase CaiB-like acyl-CoA transferase